MLKFGLIAGYSITTVSTVLSEVEVPKNQAKIKEKRCKPAQYPAIKQVTTLRHESLARLMGCRFADMGSQISFDEKFLQNIRHVRVNCFYFYQPVIDGK